MASYRVVGAVSETLRDLLKDRMEIPAEFPGMSSFDVTVYPPLPRARDGQVTSEEPRVNLFLYRVTENEFLKNQEIPGRGGGLGNGQPPLSLDLHYLVTAHGTTGTPPLLDETPAHFLLGSAMRVLHDHAILTDKLLRRQGPKAGEPVLSAHLLGEFEKVKLVMEPLSLEDVTKVFTALTHPFRASAAYMVSVVQIESTRGRAYPRPVGEPPVGPRVVVLPARAPAISELLVRREESPEPARSQPYARVGDVLVLRGSGFSGEGLHVVLGRLRIPVEATREDEVEVEVPDATLPDGAPIPPDDLLQPGPLAVSVLAAAPGMPHAGVSSNRAALMLVPRVTGLALDRDSLPPTLAIAGRRIFHERLPGETLLGQLVFPKHAYDAPSGASLTLALPDTLPAKDVPCVVSGKLDPYAQPSKETPQLRVTIGADGPRTVTLASQPLDLPRAATALQEALRAAPGGGHAFAAARVAVVDDRLVVVPGGMRAADDVVVDAVPLDPTADELKLRTAGLLPPAKAHRALLSGALLSFPALRAPSPQAMLEVGAAQSLVSLAPRPATLEDARDALQAGLASAGRTDALVGLLDAQLLVLLDETDPVSFHPTPEDPTTAAQLLLRARYPVRVRVNGAESLDLAEVPLP